MANLGGWQEPPGCWRPNVTLVARGLQLAARRSSTSPLTWTSALLHPKLRLAACGHEPLHLEELIQAAWVQRRRGTETALDKVCRCCTLPGRLPWSCWAAAKPHRRRSGPGGVCTAGVCGLLPLLAWLAGQLIPAIGGRRFRHRAAGDPAALAVFLLAKLAQFGQDTLLASPPCGQSWPCGRASCSPACRSWNSARLEKALGAADLTYRLTEDATGSVK